MKTLIVTLSIQTNNNDFTHLENSLNLIETYLEYTDFSILVLTNNIKFYDQYKNDRLILVDYDKKFKEPIMSGGFFNMHIKRLTIKLGMEYDYDIIYYNDCDCFIDGWDNLSYNELIEQDYDIIFPKPPIPELGSLYSLYEHFKLKIDKEFVGLLYPGIFESPNPPETRVIFKNNNKLKLFIDYWDKISKNNKDFFTYYDSVYFGSSSNYAKMKMSNVTQDMCFTKFCKIKHNNKTLNYFGYPYE
jgi:hypothetical protein